MNTSQLETPQKINKAEVETNIKLPTDMNHSTATGSTGNSVLSNGTSNGRRLLEDTKSQVSQEGSSESNVNDSKDVKGATVENNEGLEAEADQSFELFRDNDELPDEYNYDYDDYVDESMWGDEEWTEAQHEKLEDYVNIDAHVLCTPVSLNPIDSRSLFCARSIVFQTNGVKHNHYGEVLLISIVSFWLGNCRY